MAAPLAEITTILREVIARRRRWTCSPTTRFDDLANWDSMDLVAVVVEAECRYNLQFDLPDIDRLVTVGDLRHMIETKQALSMA